MWPFKRISPLLSLIFFVACESTYTPPALTPTPLPTATAMASSTPAQTPALSVPEFEHIVIIVFENWPSDTSLEDPLMPVFNQYAQEYTLLTQYYGVTHPSLPNYLALISGETFGVTENCTDCFFNAQTLPDLIEASGRTWRTYQEDMPEPCYVDSTDSYAQKHNPFVYFDAIRLNKLRCNKAVVSLDALQMDVKEDQLPNFIFITPNICNDAHDCTLDVADKWLKSQLDFLVPALGGADGNYLLSLMFEEGDDNAGCCGLPEDNAGGRIPVVLVSPHVKNNYKDDTPYSHYSLLRTISDSWGLPYLGHAADAGTQSIVAPWK